MASIFLSYSHKDESRRSYVESHFGALRRLHDVQTWSDTNIGVGKSWESEIEAAMRAADAAILLISADFMASRYINDVEIPFLQERAATEGLKIWPLLLSPCAWKLDGWLSALELRPRRAKALSTMTRADRDTAMAAFVAEVHAELSASLGASTKTVAAELIISADLTEAERMRLTRVLEETLASGGPVTIKRVKPGSTRLFLELTEAQLERLRRLAGDGFVDPRISALVGPLDEIQRKGLELFVFRGLPVVRDETVARFFGVETRALNQAVKRNAEKFDDTYAFVLTDNEMEALRSQTVISNTGPGGRRAPHRVFSEPGVMMAGTLLRTPQAVEATRLLVDIFVRARAERANTLSAAGGQAIQDALTVFDIPHEDTGADESPTPPTRRRRPRPTP